MSHTVSGAARAAQCRLPLCWASAVVLLIASTAASDELVVLQGDVARASVATGGGGIVEFRFLNQETNPLNWEVGDFKSASDWQPAPRGHFLCLDRWGAPSEAEAKHGMPFHGEAAHTLWQLTKSPAEADRAEAIMRCELPLAGMRVQRKISLASQAALLTVEEQVTNTNRRGRIYNMVQHPSLAPPFLDDSTLVDSNARHGFWQETPPSDKSAAGQWPTLLIDGKQRNLRRFRNGPGKTTRHDVSSFVFLESDKFGWVTACNPSRQLLLGYFWPTGHYPWLNIWRHKRDGKVAARGLEFGTTGYHQPFGRLVETGRLLERPLYDYLDAGETAVREYAAFLVKIPSDFQGVAEIRYQEQELQIVESRQPEPRTLVVEAGSLFSE